MPWGLCHADLEGQLGRRIDRHLVRYRTDAGPEGIAAGSLAEQVEVSPSNASFHLKELERAGLVSARRAARSVVYSAEYDALSGLIRFLMEDCCSGCPEICMPALAAPCCRPGEGARR